ncbi:MAG: hypothetical protein AB2448_08080, partial [Moorella sp. (in: firmicutes)]
RNLLKVHLDMKKIYTAAPLPAKVKIFIDTGAFIALGWEKDPYHEIAVNFYRSHRNKWRMFTSNYIIAETYTWLRYHTSSLHALSFLETVKKLQSKDRLTLIQIFGFDSHLAMFGKTVLPGTGG